jgi:hypothetical protein
MIYSFSRTDALREKERGKAFYQAGVINELPNDS